MPKSFFTILPLLIVGVMLPDDSCRQNNAGAPDLAGLQDGPYVSYANDLVYAKYIVTAKGPKRVVVDSLPMASKDSLLLQVATDEKNKTFQFRLKKELQVEKTEYPGVNKQLVISDIEGNFEAFRKLLQGNGVMDANYNWAFGDGHLVLVGDFFDRGEQVTEVLWLIYSLEEKAKAAGGYIHFVLGNHEIMNLNGDLRYVNKKYMENAELLKEKYESLFGEHTELGKWLRTKNIVEKIGDVIYVHGGISGEVNRLNLTASAINELARPWYPDSTYTYPDKKIDTLFGDFGPFWYRGYYMGDRKANQLRVDSVLQQFNVKQIVTGHSMVADTVSVWYNGKLINTDTHHAKGHSEALLIEGGNFYRVNAQGKRVQLPVDGR